MPAHRPRQSPARRAIKVLPVLLCALPTCARHAAPPGTAPTPPAHAELTGAGSPADFTLEGPLEFVARPTTPPITPIDLMSRLYIFADDSMMGRREGTEGAEKATAYLEHEVRRMGLVPAGDNGSFFQDIHYVTTVADVRSTIVVDNEVLVLGRDFAPMLRAGARAVRGEFQVIYGGSTTDSIPRISSAQASGKLVMLSQPAGGRGGRGGGRGGRGAIAALAPGSPLLGAAAIVIAGGETLPSAARSNTALHPDSAEMETLGPERITVTSAVAEKLLGADPATVPPGTLGRTARTIVLFGETHLPSRNVVALLRGLDPALRDEYVAIGAHSDHIGLATPVDHDSLRAYNKVIRPRGLNDPARQPTPDEWTRIRAIRDSSSQLHPARRDSINNGADDNGSGSVVLLEIAESLARESAKPRRSILFVWHAGEETGLLGSAYFTDHPTVPRDSIVAQLNMDMIGRGRASDHEGGGPEYLRVIGSRRLSTELGDLAERVNTEGRHGFVFDYSYDAPGHPMNSYCRSDHYNYARYGIPIVYMGTGVEADYHMVTDEPQYIDYMNMARRAVFVRDLALAVGNLDHRPVVDHPKPDPKATCRQ
jgi:Peptidase family M28